MYIIHNEKVLTYIDYQPVYKGLNVTEFGEETNDCDSHNSALCYRHNHIVHFVLEGTGCFYRDGKTFSLSKGKAFVITPENLIRYEAEKGKSWTYCWISFSGTRLRHPLRTMRLYGRNGGFRFRGRGHCAFEKISFRPARGGRDKRAVFALSVGAMCFEVLRNCAAKLRSGEPKDQGMSSSIIDTAVAYMQANLHKPMNVSQLCRELGISRTYFSTLFESTLKQPPYQYLQNLRIQRASELLLSDKNLHVYEVAGNGRLLFHGAILQDVS